MQNDLFEPALVRSPVLVAWGGGVDSTAMIVEMVRRGEPIDQVLMALTKSENPITDKYVEYFCKWMDSKGLSYAFVEQEPTRIKAGSPMFDGLYEKCLSYGVLPSISFGFASCSINAKQQPQENWVKTWPLGQQAIKQGLKIVKCIGYDDSPADSKRYAEREGFVTEKYEMRYPLREWKMKRDDCEAAIIRAGLKVPPKSACYMCAATKPREVDRFDKEVLRRIVLMEARAKPRLKNVDGLWRKPVKGTRGGTPRPGSMTEYIRIKSLLPAPEIDFIETEAIEAFNEWLETVGDEHIAERKPVGPWLAEFDDHHKTHAGGKDTVMPPYPETMKGKSL